MNQVRVFAAGALVKWARVLLAVSGVLDRGAQRSLRRAADHLIDAGVTDAESLEEMRL